MSSRTPRPTPAAAGAEPGRASATLAARARSDHRPEAPHLYRLGLSDHLCRHADHRHRQLRHADRHRRLASVVGATTTVNQVTGAGAQVSTNFATGAVTTTLTLSTIPAGGGAGSHLRHLHGPGRKSRSARNQWTGSFVTGSLLSGTLAGGFFGLHGRAGRRGLLGHRHLRRRPAEPDRRGRRQEVSLYRATRAAPLPRGGGAVRLRDRQAPPAAARRGPCGPCRVDQPLAPEQFLADHWGRRPVHIPAPPGSDQQRGDRLGVAQPAGSPCGPITGARAHQAAAEQRPGLARFLHGPCAWPAGGMRRLADPAKVEMFLAMGASSVADAVEEVAFEIRALTDALARRFAARVEATWLRSFQGCGGLCPHCDLHEVFAIHRARREALADLRQPCRESARAAGRRRCPGTDRCRQGAGADGRHAAARRRAL